MRVELGYYNEYIKVIDPMPFSLADLDKAQTRVYWETGMDVTFWPMNIELNERTACWEVYFIRPVPDKDYIEGVQPLPLAI